jgi:hypothetical protein
MDHDPSDDATPEAARGSERLLRGAPRWVEQACVLPLFALAFLLFFPVSQYLRFQAYYGRNVREKALDWAVSGAELFLASLLIGLAVILARGVSRRADGGLFSPNALRTWGVVFAVMPVVLVAFTWHVLIHFHFIMGWISAAIACFVLAKRRERQRRTESGPPAIE